MKKFIAAVALSATLSGCGLTQTWEELTPTQKRWTAFAASVVVVGAIAAHEMDNGNDSFRLYSDEDGDLNQIPCNPDGTC